jgi:hypothetical protein
MTRGWCAAPRWNAAGPRTPSAVRTWRAGAEYRCCAWYSRWFWGPRLHPVCTLHVQIIIGDKNYYGRRFEAALPCAGLHLLRPARHGEPERAGTQFFKPLRQIIESINDTLKGQLDLGRYGGHTPAHVAVRILQRMR